MDKFIIAVLFFLSAPAGAADVLVNLVKDYAGPLEIIEKNTSASTEAMTEIRALNNVNCAHDLGVSGSNYSADATLKANEAFLIGESTCAGILIKQNNDTYIRFSLGLAPVDKFVIEPSKVTVTGKGGAQFLVNGDLGKFEVFSGGNDKDVFAGNVNAAPFHLMTNRNAKITLNPNGSVELWPSACQAPVHAGVTLCVEGGKLKAVTATGTTVLAQ